jgi:O-glycosyl hydrolase
MKGTSAVFTTLFSLLLISSAQMAFAAGATVTVDYNQPKQTLSGFGASITWLAGDLNSFTPADQSIILDSLYSTTKPRDI